MSTFRELKRSDVADRRVVVRVDWNVPITPSGEIGDTFRIDRSLATIQKLRKYKPKSIVLLSHLGNPVVRPGDKLSRIIAGNHRLVLAPIAKYVHQSLRLKSKLEYLEVENLSLPAYQLTPELSLLENLRFDPGELTSDKKFARRLAELGDIYINEAFSESHREVASLDILSGILPAYAGWDLVDEVTHLDRFLQKEEKPTIFVLGGAKVKDKILLIDNLLKRADAFLLGGVMANTFLAAQGIDLKQSLVEQSKLDAAKELFNRAPQKFILPLDFTWERNRVLDIGPQTIALFDKYIKKAKLVFWNGPMGWTDSGRSLFEQGTLGVAKSIGKSPAKSVLAGGDTVSVIDRAGLKNNFTFISVGGGSTLAYLAGEKLPGLAHLARE